jgi:hypothetical protein
MGDCFTYLRFGLRVNQEIRFENETWGDFVRKLTEDQYRPLSLQGIIPFDLRDLALSGSFC